MRRRALLLGVLAAGCAGDGPGVAADIEAAADTELRRRPAFYVNGEARGWLVRRDGHEAGLLWGTWHVAYDDATVMPRAVRARFNASASLTVERLLSRSQYAALRGAQEGAVRRPDPSALSRLGAETLAALAEAGVDAGDAGLSLLGLAEAVSANAMTEPAPMLPHTGIVDANLVGFAQSIGVPVRALEAEDGYVDPLYQEPNGPAAAALLRQVLRQGQDARAFRRALRSLYAAGRVDRVLAATVGWRAEPADLARDDAARDGLLTRRNLAWLPGLERTLREDGFHFVAFGAGHLMGDDGVVALLRGRGWDVAACVADRCGLPA